MSTPYTCPDCGYHTAYGNPTRIQLHRTVSHSGKTPVSTLPPVGTRVTVALYNCTADGTIAEYVPPITGTRLLAHVQLDDGRFTYAPQDRMTPISAEVTP